MTFRDVFLTVLSLVIVLPFRAVADAPDTFYFMSEAVRVKGVGPSMSDGEHYLDRDGGALYSVAYANAGDRTLLFDMGKLKFDDYVLSPDGKTLLVYESKGRSKIYRHSFTSPVSMVRQGEKPVHILSSVRDLGFSPDSKYVAYSLSNDLYLYEMATGRSIRITDDGKWNHVINGTSDWVYEEEYGFTKAYSFSPSGRSIAYLRFDESEVRQFQLMRYDSELYNKAFSFKYPKAGERNSVVEIWVYDIDSGEKRRVATGTETDQYLFNLGWTPDEKLYFYRVNRPQNRFDVLVEEKDRTVHTVYSESSPTYVERPDESTVTFVDPRTIVVREETTSGFMHLYRIDIRSGKRTVVTSGRWEVLSVLGVDRNGVYYTSNESGMDNVALYHVGLDGSNRRILGRGDGVCRISPSCGMKYFVCRFSSMTVPPVVTVCDSEGNPLRTIDDSSERVARLDSWPRRKMDHFVTERGDTLELNICLPRSFDSKKRYPVLISQYSGPGSKSVTNSFTADWTEALPSCGYIVVTCDTRGTGRRGEAFKKLTYGCLGKYETEDLVSLARWLQTLPYINSDRIGVYGWSYGGFMSLNCAFRSMGLFRMAIAVAPVTSWRYYDTIYTEIYNGNPNTNPNGYDDYSPIAYAEYLSPSTRLLIMHGTADDNVHFQNTMELCRRLNRSMKEYDMMVFPDQDHSMRPSCQRSARAKMIRYTLENL